MFAVVRTGGKQYRVAEGDKIAVEKLAGEAGESIVLEDVLLAGEGADLADASKVKVSAQVIAQAKSEKVIIFKKRRRHNYRRKNGHRQQLTLLRIIGVGETVVTAPKAAAAAPKKDTSEQAADPGVHKAAPTKDAAGSAKADLDTTNLSLISGIGPAIEKKLREAGVSSWSDIAAWDDDTIAKMNEDLKLGNRPVNDEWVEQAKELLAGKPPRAKIDQAEAASGEDK